MNRKHLERNLQAAVDHQRAGRHDEAEALYAQCREAFPKVFDVWYLSGTLAVHRDQPEAAIPLLQRALRLSPSSSQCKLFLGMALADTGRFAEAEKPLRAALEKHPNYPEAWENLADCLCALDRVPEAVECLRRVLAQRPDRSDLRERIDAMSFAGVTLD
jgi:tetratricopeptide (TPR) repeat protein